jgi:anti-anti-sigma factor
VDEAPKALSIDVDEPVEGSFVVTLTGELDLASATELSQRLAAVPVASGGRVVVDVSGLGFIDSTGLNCLVTGARNVSARDGSLIVAAAPSHVARIFDVVRLGESVQLASSVDEALARPSEDAGR